MKDPKNYKIPHESPETLAAKIELGKQILRIADADEGAKPILQTHSEVINQPTGLIGINPKPADDEPQMKAAGWWGFDLDGTIAKYDGFKGSDVIGEPIAPMIAKIKSMLDDGIDVRIFTARVSPSAIVGHAKEQNIEPDEELQKVVSAIVNWCVEHIGRPLQITHSKDFAMIGLYDDRAIQIVPNEGRRADGQPL